MTFCRSILCWCIFCHCATIFHPLWAQGATGPKSRRSCRVFVQRFYKWYVPQALKEGKMSASDRALKYKGSAFSPGLLRALKEDSEAQAEAKGELVGLDFDPFLNTQDPSPQYAVGNVTLKGESCWANVNSVSSGKNGAKGDVVPELVIHKGHWVFVNFHYPSPSRPEFENLLSLLTYLRTIREQHSK